MKIAYQDFRDTLAEYFPTFDEQKRLAELIGLRWIHIHFSPKPIDALTNFLKQVNDEDKREVLFSVLLKDHSELQSKINRYKAELSKSTIFTKESARAIQSRLADNADRKRLADLVYEFQIDSNFLLVCKELHDVLHQLQLQQNVSIQRNVSQTDWTIDTLNSLQLSCDSFFVAVTKASDAIGTLRIQGEFAELTKEWISKLKKASHEISQEIRTSTSGSTIHVTDKSRQIIRLATIQIVSILQQEPPLINRQLKIKAAKFNAVELIELLKRIVETDDNFELIQTIDWLETWLVPALKATIEQHSEWQNVEVVLERIRSQLQYSQETISEEIEILWGDLFGELQRLCGHQLTGETENQVLGKAKNVSDQIRSKNIGLLKLHFTGMSSCIKQHFFVLDQNLKTECQNIAPSTKPLLFFLPETS